MSRSSTLGSAVSARGRVRSPDGTTGVPTRCGGRNHSPSASSTTRPSPPRPQSGPRAGTGDLLFRTSKSPRRGSDSTSGERPYGARISVESRVLVGSFNRGRGSGPSSLFRRSFVGECLVLQDTTPIVSVRRRRTETGSYTGQTYSLTPSLFTVGGCSCSSSVSCKWWSRRFSSSTSTGVDGTWDRGWAETDRGCDTTPGVHLEVTDTSCTRSIVVLDHKDVFVLGLAPS